MLGRDDTFAANGGVVVDYQYSGFFLGNGGDEVILLDTFGQEVARVEYDGGTAFPDPNGASMALASPLIDNNVGTNWCTSTTPFGDGDLGTPGAVNDCPPPVLVINEIMQNDSGGGSGTDPAVAAAAAAAIDGLVEADAILAEVAVMDAIDAADAAGCFAGGGGGGGDSDSDSDSDSDGCSKALKEIDKAFDDLEDAEDELQAGKPDKAIDRYRKAWEHVLKALDKIPGS